MIAVHWFRRDLRLDDNSALNAALSSGVPVLPVFIFDTDILDDLEPDDARVYFIYRTLEKLHRRLGEYCSGICVVKGRPEEVFKRLLAEYEIQAVYANEDYEPSAIKRDRGIAELLRRKNVELKLYKDQVVFAKNDIVQSNGKPYTVFTPYKNKWLSQYGQIKDKSYDSLTDVNFLEIDLQFPSLDIVGFCRSHLEVPHYDLTGLDEYENQRDLPAVSGTTGLSPHLRFGTVSVRQLVSKTIIKYPGFVSELIWREFFMQILYHSPRVVSQNFKRKYDGIQWRNNKIEFEKWRTGKTGYPMVDAGMRELNETGLMHNRVRMITASFLCKHLLIDWRWGEAYFAQKLLDYELSSNNGNWQWAAGTGCDAAPYFRIFNPATQQKKFDPDLRYIKRWVPEFGTDAYPEPMVDHKTARERALRVYKAGISQV